VSRAWRFRIEAALATAVGAAIRPLPRRLALWLGGRLGALWGALDRRHVAIAVDNLTRSFPEWSAAQAACTAHAVYAHFGRVMLDLLWLRGRGKDEILSIVDMSGLEHAHRAHAGGRGTVFVCAHFGGWEIHGLAYPWLSGRNIGMIVRALDNPALDRKLCELRAMSGNSIFYKQRALQQVLKRLREGGSVAILIDQNVQEQDGIFVDFFGRPAATTTVAAALAVKTGCGLVPAHAELMPDGRYRAVCDPPIEWTPTGDRQTDIALLTQKMTAIIEGWVRRRPEQWLWMHRRWKTQPTAAVESAARAS
jgi:Kdo2-lipid IVA lauroyltransferase/acyltransferase